MKSIRLLFLALMATVLSTANAQINTDQVMIVGQNAMYFEDYLLSIQYFNQAIQAKPYLAQPYFLRSVAKFNLEDYQGAIDDATKALELNPFIPDAWEVRGIARQNLMQDSAAIDDYDKALELIPRNRQIMYNKAMAQTSAGRYDDADKTFNELIRFYPTFDNAIIGRANLRLAQKDTVSALADIERAILTNRNAFNAYVMRANIAITRGDNYEQALADLNEAVKLEPRMAGLYINRAFLRYNLNDYFGSMADYDYAIELEPNNIMARFNRGLLLAEVSDNDKALSDFTYVLQQNPDDYRSLYNRSVIQYYKHNYREAIADISRLIDAFPDFLNAYFMRSEFYREAGDLKHANADFNHGVALYNKIKKEKGKVDEMPDADMFDSKASGEGLQPEQLVSKRFASLLTTDGNIRQEEEYNNNSIRGHIQNRDIAIEIEPYMQLSYFSTITQLKESPYYIKEIDDLNATRMLRFVVQVVNNVPQNIDQDLIDRHFESIKYYDSYLSSHTPRTIDYIGRAMDFLTLRNYDAALLDLNRAIALSPDYAPAYMLRAQAAYLNRRYLNSTGVAESIKPICDDIDTVLSLTPANAIAWYNKGNLLVEMADYTSAISAYTRAIELKPELGEAYYNRGYAYLKLGNERAGLADLSKSGELGIASAYNLIKRMTR